MHLKKIEINGFKSFAQKTELTFFPPKDGKHSITAIVGPNGSGKSNVADAVRWVLGEQRMAQLRGKKNQDIIFSGSSAKGQLSLASVSLYLDNTDRRAPVDFDELILTRRIYRSGESEYKINGKNVRFKDFQLLLAQAQFARSSYGVIGQGLIDKILLQTPAERKLFFDEAVGIKEFQLKRREAYLKLKKTNENIAQGELIRNEIEPRLKNLAKQVKRLDERQEIEHTLRDTQEIYYVHVWHGFNERYTGIESEINTLQSSLHDAESLLQTTQKELATLAQAESREVQFATLQKEYQSLKDVQHALERERLEIKSKLSTEYGNIGQHEMGWLQDRLDTLSEQLIHAQKQIADIEIDIAQTQEKKDTALANKSQVEKRKREIYDALSLKQEGDRPVFQAQSYSMRLIQTLFAHKHEFGTMFGIAAELATAPKDLALALDVAAGKHVSSVVVQNEEVAKACIQYLRTHRLGIATFLPVSTIRPFTISHDALAVQYERGAVGFALDLLQYDQKFDAIFSFIFKDTLIVEDADAARSIGIGRIRMVTREGDVFEKSGSIQGGFRKRNGSEVSFAMTNISGGGNALQDKDALQQELLTVEEKIAQFSDAVIQADTHLGSLRGKLEILHEQEKTVHVEYARLESDQKLRGADESTFNETMKQYQTRKLALDQSFEEMQQQVHAVQSKIEAFNKEEDEKQKRVFLLQEKMQQEQQTVNGLSGRLSELQVALAKVQTNIENITTEVHHECNDDIAQIVARRGVDTIVVSPEALFEEIKKLKYKLQLIGGIDEDVRTEYQETKERFDVLDIQLIDLKRACADLEKLVEELDDCMKKRRATVFKDIQKEFSRYFALLFNGGEAKLVEVFGYDDEDDVFSEESDDEENTDTDIKGRGKKVLKGIEIVACPPGKKIKYVQSLSGGERTMAAIALVCAVLRTNPAPFIVLDEVEAALDEANSIRFTNILDELARQSQCILITHNRATMHAADALYGVTMGGQGISKLVSVKIS